MKNTDKDLEADLNKGTQASEQVRWEDLDDDELEKRISKSPVPC